MILTVHAGRANVSAAIFNEETPVAFTLFPSVCADSKNVYREKISLFFAEQKIQPGDFSGCVLTSRNEEASSVLTEILSSLLLHAPLILSRESFTKTFSKTVPESFDGRMLADMLALKNREKPVAFIDLSSVTTIGLINSSGDAAGACFFPGVQAGADALFEGASQLFSLRITGANTSVGKNTDASVQGAAIYGNAAKIDGLITRIEAGLSEKNSEAPDTEVKEKTVTKGKSLAVNPDTEVKEKTVTKNLTVILTGSTANMLQPHIHHETELIPHLMHHGMIEFYKAATEADK